MSFPEHAKEMCDYQLTPYSYPTEEVMQNCCNCFQA